MKKKLVVVAILVIFGFIANSCQNNLQNNSQETVSALRVLKTAVDPSTNSYNEVTADSLADQIIVLSHDNNVETTPVIIEICSEEQFNKELEVNSFEEFLDNLITGNDNPITGNRVSDLITNNKILTMVVDYLTAIELLESEARYYANLIKERESNPTSLNLVHFHRYQFYAKLIDKNLDEFGLPFSKLEEIWEKAKTIRKTEQAQKEKESDANKNESGYTTFSAGSILIEYPTYLIKTPGGEIHPPGSMEAWVSGVVDNVITPLAKAKTESQK